jgi:transposase-like protein
MVLKPMACPTCQHTEVVKHVQTSDGKPRFRCQNPAWARHTCLLDYGYQGSIPDVTPQMVDMTMNGRGMREMARVLPSSPTTVMKTFKKRTGQPSRAASALVAITASAMPGDHRERGCSREGCDVERCAPDRSAALVVACHRPAEWCGMSRCPG